MTDRALGAFENKDPWLVLWGLLAPALLSHVARSFSQAWVTRYLLPPCSTEYSPTYYEFVGVSGCQDVLHLYRLLWASTVFNVLGLFLGIVTAAVLGAFKDMVSSAAWGWAATALQMDQGFGPMSLEACTVASLSSLTNGETEAREDHPPYILVTARLHGRFWEQSLFQHSPPLSEVCATQDPTQETEVQLQRGRT